MYSDFEPNYITDRPARSHFIESFENKSKWTNIVCISIANK